MSTTDQDTLSQRLRDARQGRARLAEKLRSYREKRRTYDQRFGDRHREGDGYREQRGARGQYRA